MSLYCVDANLFITAWEERRGYPINVLPTLWRKLAQVKDKIIIIDPVFNEIDHISPADRRLSREEKKRKYPLRTWLEDNGFQSVPIDDDVNNLSLNLEKEYEVKKISKGANPIDICLIAYAKINDKTVVTLEKEQNQKPRKKCNYKIPLICKEQDVKCITFMEMLSELKIRI